MEFHEDGTEPVPPIENRESPIENGLAASLGFEPRQRDPESLVLPLHHEALFGAKDVISAAGFRKFWSRGL